MNYPKDALEQMFQLQKDLIKPYIGIEGLPQYPINIDSKANQALLKDFISRIIEELGESFEVHLELSSKNLAPKPDFKETQPLVKEFNEEIADTLHFFLELFIYSNIETSEIDSYYELWLTESELIDSTYFTECDMLTKCVRVAKYLNQQTGIQPYATMGYNMSDKENNTFLDESGSYVSQTITENLKMLYWDLTYRLQLVRNCLKNKPWKQTEVETNTRQFHERLMTSWISLFNLLAFLNFKPNNIYEVYKEKNLKNQERIKNKY